MLELEVEIIAPQEEWGFGLSLDNSLGTALYAVTSFDLDAVLPQDVGLHQLRLTLPDVPLGAGQYLINVGLGDQHRRSYHRVEGAAPFAIGVSGRGAGLLSVTPRLETGSPKPPRS